jgi:hypothetical protein
MLDLSFCHMLFTALLEVDEVLVSLLQKEAYMLESTKQRIT